MLKVIANIYANEKTDFDEVINSLKSDGYEIAYQNETSAIILKEVDDLESNDSDA